MAHRNRWYWMLALLPGSIMGCAGLAKPHRHAAVVGQSVQQSPLNSSVAAVAAYTKDFRRGVARLTDVVTPADNLGTGDSRVIAKDDPTSLSYEPGPLGANLYIMAARLAEKNGHVEDALRQYRQAIEVDPRNRVALIGLARLQHRTGEITAAVNTYRDALSWYRDDAVIMNDLGLCYARSGQLDQAVSLLRRAVQLQPGRQMYRNNLAAALVEADRPDEAVAHLSQVSDPAVANYNVGYLLSRSGHADQASEFLHRALELAPSLSQARVMLDRIEPRLGALPPSQTPRSTLATPLPAGAMPDVRPRAPSGRAAGELLRLQMPQTRARPSDHPSSDAPQAQYQLVSHQAATEASPPEMAIPAFPKVKAKSRLLPLRLPKLRTSRSAAVFVAPSPDR